MAAMRTQGKAKTIATNTGSLKLLTCLAGRGGKIFIQGERKNTGAGAAERTEREAPFLEAVGSWAYLQGKKAKVGTRRNKGE